MGFGIMGYFPTVIFGIMGFFSYFGVMGFGIMGFGVMGRYPDIPPHKYNDTTQFALAS